MKNIKIIIIDVKKTKASVLADLLNGLAYSVIGSFASDEDTLALCVKERPDIIILGIASDGNRAGMKIVEALRTQYQPLLIYCADQFYRQAGEAMLPSQGYIVPPFNAGQLSAILSSVLENNSAGASLMAEEKFRQLFNNNPEYCYLISPDGTILDINDSALRILGYTREEITGKPLSIIYHPDSKANMDILFEKWKASGNLHDERIDIITRNGQRRKVILHATSIRDNQGSILHSISYQHDITDFDHIFDAYRDSERKYRNIFENAPMGIFQTSSTGKVLAVNNKMAAILGYDSPAEAIEAFNDIGKELYVDPTKRKEFLKLLTRDKTVVNFEYEAFKKDGTKTWISMNAHVSDHNEDGSFIINGFSEDITARKKAHSIIDMGISHMVLINELNSDVNKNAGTDEIIKKTCDRLRDIHNLRFADFYFKAVSTDFSEYLIYQYSNIQSVILGAAEKLSGLSLQKIRIPLFDGSVYRELYTNRIPMEFNGKEEVSRAIRDFVPAEKKFLRALAGEVAQIAGNKYVYLAPLIVRGEAIGHIGFNRGKPFSREEKESVTMVIDKLASIFDKIRTDEALRSSLREKDILLKEIHHRVKNNMQIISSLLALQSGFINDERDLELFADSQNRIRSMSLIHEQLYQSSNLSQIDFRSYTDRLVTEVLQSFNTGSRISVDMDIINSPLPINVAIPCALILNELLSNALKHAFPDKHSGKVHISFVKNDGHRYIFSVSDNGIGFSGSPDTSTSKSLGMHLVSELTRQIGGTLTIQHKNGTSFIIEFSDLYEPSRDEKISCLEPRRDSEKLILIVEDDLITGNFLKKMLEKRDYKIPPVMVTGESAINFVRQCRPDLIIMDIMLGGPMDGIETARVIKEQYGIPVIFSSGSSEDATLTRVQKIRPAGFILKPIDKERLLSLIRQVLGE